MLIVKYFYSTMCAALTYAPRSVFLTSGCGQVQIVINYCISVLYLECWYVFVLVLDYCHKVVSREQISWNMLVVLR